MNSNRNYERQNSESSQSRQGKLKTKSDSKNGKHGFKILTRKSSDPRIIINEKPKYKVKQQGSWENLQNMQRTTVNSGYVSPLVIHRADSELDEHYLKQQWSTVVSQKVNPWADKSSSRNAQVAPRFRSLSAMEEPMHPEVKRLNLANKSIEEATYMMKLSLINKDQKRFIKRRKTQGLQNLANMSIYGLF